MSLNSCPRCGTLAKCRDSRNAQYEGVPYVRRRYVCEKFHRYSTVEVLAQGGKGKMWTSSAMGKLHRDRSVIEALKRTLLDTLAKIEAL